MAESSTKLDPAAEQASAGEPQLAKQETEKVTTGVTDDSKKPEEDSTKASSDDKPAQSYTAMATNVASTATSAVKDNVFAMFGGGSKKDKEKEKDKDEGADDEQEPSGSSKAQAQKKDEEGGAVSAGLALH